MTDNENEVSERYELLANERRRQLCRVLAAAERKRWPIERLADRIVDYETDDSPLSRAARARRIAIALYHVHLPKLADAGVLEFDPDDGTVRACDRQLLEAVADGEDVPDDP